MVELKGFPRLNMIEHFHFDLELPIHWASVKVIRSPKPAQTGGASRVARSNQLPGHQREARLPEAIRQTG